MPLDRMAYGMSELGQWRSCVAWSRHGSFWLACSSAHYGWVSAGGGAPRPPAARVVGEVIHRRWGISSIVNITVQEAHRARRHVWRICWVFCGGGIFPLDMIMFMQE